MEAEDGGRPGKNRELKPRGRNCKVMLRRQEDEGVVILL